MKITNRDVSVLLPVIGELNQQRLQGYAPFAVNAMMKGLLARAEEIEVERQKILTEFSEKDDSGEPVIKDGSFVLSDEPAAAKAFEDVLAQEMVLKQQIAMKDLQSATLSGAQAGLLLELGVVKEGK